MLFIVLAALNIPVWLFLPPWVLPASLSAISLLFYSFVFNFFRCPKRVYHGNSRNLVVSSVDGKVVALERVFEPEFLKSEAILLSVFMSPLNVHANWYPTSGVVEYVAHHSGRFISAYLPKSSTENERSTIGLRCDNGWPAASLSARLPARWPDVSSLMLSRGTTPLSMSIWDSSNSAREWIYICPSIARFWSKWARPHAAA